MLRIGEFSRLSRVSIRMLRHYDEIGLLRPAEIDRSSGYRYYSPEQLADIERIVALRDMGFGLARIAELLAAGSDPVRTERMLLERRTELLREAQSVRDRLQLVERALERAGKEDTTMEHDILLKHIPAHTVAGVRDRIPTYDREGELWGTLMAETAHLALRDAEVPMWYAVFHDEEYRETDAEVEVRRAVAEPGTDTGHVRFYRVEAQLVASVTVRGPYSELGPANAAVAAWITGNGYRLAGPMFNIYHVGPANTPDPAGYVTELCYPVVSA